MELLLIAAAYVAGAFTPAVGRKIKAAFVSEGAVVKKAASADLAKAEVAVAAEVKKA